MRAKVSLILGAALGASVAAAFTFISLAGAWLIRLVGADTARGAPSGGLLLAWWIATPLCCAAGAWLVCRFRRLRVALLAGVACAVPWVVGIHAGARERLPADVQAWAGVLARAALLGGAAGLVVWRTLREEIRGFDGSDAQ